MLKYDMQSNGESEADFNLPSESELRMAQVGLLIVVKRILIVLMKTYINTFGLRLKR